MKTLITVILISFAFIAQAQFYTKIDTALVLNQSGKKTPVYIHTEAVIKSDTVTASYYAFDDIFKLKIFITESFNQDSIAPVNPSTGDMYKVIYCQECTSNWQNNIGKIAVYNGSKWLFYEPFQRGQRIVSVKMYETFYGYSGDIDTFMKTKIKSDLSIKTGVTESKFIYVNY